MSCYVCRIGPHGYVAKKNGIRLHRFPKKNKNQRQKWLIFCCLPSNLPNEEADKLLLCTKHFDKVDVIQSSIRTYLRQNAVPHFFPPIGAQVLTLEDLENTNNYSIPNPFMHNILDNLLDIENSSDVDSVCKMESILDIKLSQNQSNVIPNIQNQAENPEMYFLKTLQIEKESTHREDSSII